VAASGRLPLTQDKIAQQGHAIEVRLYAENADKGFLPAPGRVEVFYPPQEYYARVDTGVRSGDDIGIFYDPMIAKITVGGQDRAEAITHLKAALAETAVFGLTTNLPLLRGIARHPDFAAGRFDTGFIERELKTLLTRPPLTAPVLAAAVEEELLPDEEDWAWSNDGWRLGGSPGVRFRAREQDGTEQVFTARVGAEGITLEMGGKSQTLQPPDATSMSFGDERQVEIGGVAYNFSLTGPHGQSGSRVADEAAHPLSPMPGRVVAVHVKPGDRVEPGQALMVLEGMKMEYTVKATVAGTIEKVLHKTGDMVEAEAPLVDIKPSET